MNSDNGGEKNMTTIAQGFGREPIDARDAAELLQKKVLVTDERRRRPLYFDGRFLAARDLTAEQNYFLTRQADIGRAGGCGVVEGLLVSRTDAAPSSLHITEGHGVTAAGEIVVVPSDLTVDVADIPQIQRLDTVFGLAESVRQPARSWSGVFVVSLRAVEYSANPIAAYPTTVNGTRSVEDGDIIEAVAVTLTPYVDSSGQTELDERRSHVAYELFIKNASKGLGAGSLPIAMVAIDNGAIQWVDPWLVRREVGAEHFDILGMGFATRASREAHAQQYDHQLNDIVSEREASKGSAKFAAADYFLALPACGPMPSAAIDGSDFSQVYFPAAVDVDLSIIPDDELEAVLEESLLLPPIDLTLSADDISSTSVLVLIPVPRQNLHSLILRLETVQRQLKAAAPGMVAMRSPLETLMSLKTRLAQPTLVVTSQADAAWRSLLSSTKTLWYTRRRNLAYSAAMAGAAVTSTVTGSVAQRETILSDTLKNSKLATRFTVLDQKAATDAKAKIHALLSSPRATNSKFIMDGAMSELEALPKLDIGPVSDVVSRYSDPQLGEGVARLVSADTTFANDATLHKIAQSKEVPELDKVVRSLPDSELVAFLQEFKKVVATQSPAQIGAYITTKLKGSMQ
jgi:hypothetical protein